MYYITNFEVQNHIQMFKDQKFEVSQHKSSLSKFSFSFSSFLKIQRFLQKDSLVFLRSLYRFLGVFLGKFGTAFMHKYFERSNSK